MKQITELVADKEVAKAKELLPQAYKAIDKAEKRGVIKPNNASRKKALMSRITKEA
jgi:ribosomal protein S20